MLAMFLCVKTSPGFRPRRVVSGMRESEQPSHRISGACPLAEVGKKSGALFAVSAAHCWLFSSARVKASPEKVN